MTESQLTSPTETIALELVRCSFCRSQDITIYPAETGSIHKIADTLAYGFLALGLRL